MTEEIKTVTSTEDGQKAPTTDTLKVDEKVQKTLTQAEVDSIIEDRLRRDREAREKELGMSMKDAKALLKAKKDADDAAKTKEERLLQERDEAHKKLASLESKEKKRAALEGAKLTLPNDVSMNDLLDMMGGNDDEAIAGYVEKFKKMFPASKGLGTATTTGGAPAKPKTVVDQIADIQDKINDPKTTSHEKLTFGRQLVSLNNELMRGI